MASAEACKDREPRLPTSRAIGNEKSQQQPLYHDTQCSSPSVNSSRWSSYRPWTSFKMPSLRRLIFTFFLLAFLTVTYASVPVYKRFPGAPNGAKETSFQDLLNSVSDASLHNVLANAYEKYKHGVFPEDRTAIQAVHDDDAAAATSLVELAKRQNPNVTSVTVPASSTATVVVIGTTQTDTVVQTSGADTVVVVNTQTTVPPVESVDPVQATSSPDSPVQTTAPQTNPSSSAQAPPSHSSTNGGDVTTTGKATVGPSSSDTTLVKVSSTKSTAAATTATSASSSQQGVSTSAGAGAVTAKASITSQEVFTTTLPNGSQSTVTSYTIVPAGEQASSPGVASSTVTGNPSLQNGAVEGSQPAGIGLIGSLVAALLFVAGIL